MLKGRSNERQHNECVQHPTIATALLARLRTPEEVARRSYRYPKVLGLPRTTERLAHERWQDIPLQREEPAADLCTHHYVIANGKRGVCKVREKQGGRLYPLVHSRTSSQCVDPIAGHLAEYLTLIETRSNLVYIIGSVHHGAVDEPE